MAKSRQVDSRGRGPYLFPASNPKKSEKIEVYMFAGLAKRIFGSAKRLFNYGRVRSTNFAANLGQALCFATVFNLRRAASVMAARPQESCA